MQLKQGCSGAWIALTAALLDRASKAAISRLEPGAVLPALPGIIQFRNVTNTGVAFSLLSGQNLALIVFTTLLILGLTAWLTARPEGQSRVFRAGLWMIAGGGFGNLYDRIFYGHVIDFIEPVFVRFAVFNVADIFVCLGAVLAAIALLSEERKKEASHG